MELSSAETKSVASMSSRGSKTSSASRVAAASHAKVEAANAQTEYAKLESETMVEKARVEARLNTLQHEKEVAAAIAEASVLETIAVESEKGDGESISNEAVERTHQYVHHQFQLLSAAEDRLIEPTIPQKPGQIRVVFDSSAKCQGVSLNDMLLSGPNLINNLLGVLIQFRYNPADIAFLGEYTTTMSSVAKAINILQGESNIQMGWLLPTITSLIAKLEKTRVSLQFCKPLVDVLQDGLKIRFGEMMSDPELVAAAILNPKFKTSWTSDEDVLKLGLSYIKEHLPDHDEALLQPADKSSSASDEDDFFSNMKHVHTQNTTKQLDAYLMCTAEDVEVPQPDLSLLYERLLLAEQRGETLSHELLLVLHNLQNLTITGNNLTSSNVTGGWNERGSISRILSPKPSAIQYLPHLGQHPDSLKAFVHLGQGRTGVSLVFGVPTVRRQKQSYLLNTLGSLLFDLSSSEKNDIVIIVFIAETDTAFVNNVVESIQKNFPDHVQSGLIEVVSPSPYFYPNFTDLKETFGDSKERVKWRTKQNLDYSFLMLYAQSKGTFYVQLEDDIVAKQGYSQTMKTYATGILSEEWLFLEFSKLGFIGKLFRASDLPMVVEFFLMFHKDKPIDWLLDHILWVKVCNPERDAKHCQSEKNKLKRTYKPSLFQHVGLHSSLHGKIQNLKDKDFGKQKLFTGYVNPAASINSTLQPYKEHTLTRAYQGQDFFWGLTPKAGDYIHIQFTTPQTIKSYLFRSGNIETNGDKFYNTTVEVLPLRSSVKESVRRGQFPCCQPSSNGFIIIGSFVNGVAEGEVKSELGELIAMRLVIHSDSDVWVLLSEISIKV
ncbi:alpha-1,3-mannosyl-glycoprotein 4-beta-N-acetylglucosaminyltransferase B [Chanos chanos]|uniref:Alpha-1,3-mannosyl-glycoprotein 4-beta-N-acetylglucosaminyltransferase B n=1 Tax=Chanos chanos TaxID=29144 RepID=A0A6J2W5J3_CHACN|nr:alpha-1,3-mannosyl-glycoprotein 4-beta-N-acetylglucosaminyltransferase B-like [Chanos chanos]